MKSSAKFIKLNKGLLQINYFIQSKYKHASLIIVQRSTQAEIVN